MKRDLSKAIQRYKKKFEAKGRGVFYVSDYFTLRDLSEDEDGGTDISNLIYNTWAAAFVLGYRQAVRDRRRAKIDREGSGRE